MRASLLVASFAALALAACQVGVEGAACEVPGATAQCPGGQACGNDLRCTKRAAACASTRCVPDARRCNGTATAVERCSPEDATCGHWVEAEPCGEFACIGGANAACTCPAPAVTTVWADPAGGADAAHPPTGAESPVACRFATVTAALAAPGASTVRLAAGTFGTGETFPLAVPAGVAVRGATAPTTIIQAPGTAAALATLADGARLEALTLRAVDTTANSTTAVPLGCAGATPAALTDVTVGAAGFDDGIAVTGTCKAVLTRVDVSGATKRALVLGDTGDVTVNGGRFASSGVGIQVLGGTFTSGVDTIADGVTVTEVADNSGVGVHAFNATVKATVEKVRIHGNKSAGVYVQSLLGGSEIVIREAEIFSNAVATSGGAPIAYGTGGRSGGGILVRQGTSIAAFGLLGSKVFGNGGDQVAFWSSLAWTVGPSACGGDSNVFGCGQDATPYALAATGGTVLAPHNVWSAPGPPDPQVTLSTVNVDPACPPGVSGAPAVPACP